eukprot:TRINITY_DN26174_c0_g1_i2.p1 TRINITY_DN26174_c0_g1~~TRINITY_DN26174_c0_g1_i2.p1  ORF type:complete len:410 (+),score=93.49 TRINITY_DN26174_c0_g1_i2:479-1708(+)
MGKPRPEGFVGTEIRATEQAEAEGSEPDEQDGSEPEASAFAPPPRTDESASKPEENSEAAPSPDQSPQAMNQALDECLLQAIKTRIKDKDLPIIGNTLYAQHMRPCRRAGSNIDVKVSGFKKLAAFLAHAEELGWIALKKNSPEPVLTKVFRDHPDIREWKPWPKDATAEAAEGGESSNGGPPQASIEVELVWKMAKMKPLLEALKESAPDVAEDGCCTKADCVEVLKRYVDSRELWLKNNKKRIGPDGLLQGLIGEKKDDPSGSSGFALESLADRLLGTLPICHRVAAPVSGAAGGMKRSVRTGKPPVVQVRTDQRRGHNVTLVHGLEAYGVDMDALASCLQKALATSVTVEEASGSTQQAVVVQGFWDVAMVEWLGKVGVPPDSIQHQAKKGQGQKKAKQGSNIVKS